MYHMRTLNIHKWALEKAAQAWCQPDTCMKVMDPTLCMAFAEILDREAMKPSLGLATTKELIEELSARVDLNYQPCLGRPVCGTTSQMGVAITSGTPPT